MSVLGLVFGALLGVTGRVFAVPSNPTVDALRECLPGANCGACGFPGCDGYAAAVAEGKAEVGACAVGGHKCTAKMAEIMGVSASAGVRMVATVACQGHGDHCAQKNYQGIHDCNAAALVDNGTKIAAALGVPDSVIGLTMVALGTSLPELITAITSLIKGHGSLSLGNVIGANLFNIILVSGAAITISPFAIPAEKTIFGGINSSLIVDIPLMLAVMAIMCLPAFKKGELKRWQGILLLCIYAGFTVYQFVS